MFYITFTKSLSLVRGQTFGKGSWQTIFPDLHLSEKMGKGRGGMLYFGREKSDYGSF
jgi:hypothetical protein